MGLGHVTQPATLFKGLYIPDLWLAAGAAQGHHGSWREAAAPTAGQTVAPAAPHRPHFTSWGHFIKTYCLVLASDSTSCSHAPPPSPVPPPSRDIRACPHIRTSPETFLRTVRTTRTTRGSNKQHQHFEQVNFIYFSQRHTTSQIKKPTSLV